MLDKGTDNIFIDADFPQEFCQIKKTATTLHVLHSLTVKNIKTVFSH